ncbi:hypothetical protein [uncultured Polaribacter sp.]|uniref:hypothetical protein n=1 Tax=uncultured Polaribacter sp. TaxID=174711 RepID=UPI002633DAB8|nr:hypothetical protein [uncultured Polaribacter sp.]
MNSKWYISTLFLILFICFGTFQDQVIIPNQEIVLEFIDTKINKNEIKNTIANVKEKLLNTGVSNIKIKETKNGTLKISYYSVAPIKLIKEALSEKNAIVINQNSENKDNKTEYSDYNIDVYELTNQTKISNLEDNFVFEIESNSDRFTTNYNLFLIKHFDSHKENQSYKIAYTEYKKNPFSKDNSSCKEPEVRAGPNNYNNI